MRKSLFILLLVLAALSSCRKEYPVEQPAVTYDISQLRFNLIINYPATTKAVKSGWENGDKVFIFFTGKTSGYVTIVFDGNNWSAPSASGTVSFSETSGTLTAIYLPYGNDATASYGTEWSFSSGTDSYFLSAEKTDYSIEDTGDIATLGAALNMTGPNDYAQLFIPDSGASGTINLACNFLQPAGLANVASDGTVSEKTSGAGGGWITGFADTIGEDKGYYFSGKLSGSGQECYFAVNNSGSYCHYYKHRSTAVAGRGAYRLPALSAADWQGFSSSQYVMIAGEHWCTVNSGAATPWNNTGAPIFDAWNSLLDDSKATWIPMTIAGTSGSLVVDKTDVTHYMFLPQANYWSSTGGYYLKEDGTLTNTGTPSSAYIRQSKYSFSGGFDNPEDGGSI